MSILLNGTTGITSPNIDSQVGDNTPAAGDFTDVTVSGTLTTGGGAISPQTGFKNRIINGSMTIDQRNDGSSVTPSADTYLVDRWQYSASQTSKFTWQQNKDSVTPPVGFANYLGGSVATAVTIGAADYFALVQKIEGFNVADLGWGTANAATVTLSFRVYSSLTGTFGGTLTNSANNRSYPFTYSVAAANTWTSISLTIAGDTSGTWLATSGIGIGAQFGLGVGSTYSGTAGAWSGTQYISATGAVSVVGTLNATFYITGVQLEKGSTATPFEFRSIGTELALCQRYYQLVSSFTASGNTATQLAAVAPFQTPMRSSPSSGAQGVLSVSDGTADFTQSSAAANILTSEPNSIILLLPNFTSIVANRIYLGYRLLNSNKIILSAEL